jgi:hypothetical protein
MAPVRPAGAANLGVFGIAAVLSLGATMPLVIAYFRAKPLMHGGNPSE